MITRRGFLGFILAAPIAIKAKVSGWIPAEMSVSEPINEINFDLISASTLADLRQFVTYENLFVNDPMLAKLRSGHVESFDGGDFIDGVVAYDPTLD